MRLLIDTNRYDDFDTGDQNIVYRFESATELWIPVIVLGELLAGFAGGTKRNENEVQLRRFLQRPAVSILNVDDLTARHYGDIYQALRRQGTPVPTNDMWIAALAIQHDLILDTRDEHFLRVPGLKLLDVRHP